ncbi:SRPBCC domain-containing protein [Sphingomonas sp.]|jgi:uncharacterized protein YndB with AHSA1/START domain|uniref:SRPBCC family protein n=1 Tax=Sphingomonas sp. TaxID=28214 RepID=UPI002E36F90D|nr:SRPBCC domain-containing protein [Sphingomonas sp.]HEX4695772.1 SRPBCC domain-containing protein [Sphingomonas sp.]
MTDPIVLTVTREIAAPPERVFDAWLDPATARHFLFATPDGAMERCDIDARVGGRALITERRPQGLAEHHLQYEEIDRPRRLVFLFRACLAGVGGEEGQWTRVSMEIAAIDAGSRITLTHQMDAEWADYEEQTRHGWTMILDSLAHVMENDDG